ncbi:MAG: cytochrome P450 [Cyanobacteria bacterium P01_A01_bin.45]
MNSDRIFPDGPDPASNSVFFRRLKFIFQPVKYVEDFAKIYGDTFTIWDKKRKFAGVYISHPKALEQIFTADPDCFRVGGGNRVLQFLLGDRSLILLDGKTHRRQRQLLAPPFHGERMRAYGETIRHIVEQVSDEWEIGQPLIIREPMQEIALRAILRVVFGLEEGERFEKLRNLLNSILESISSPVLSTTLFFRVLQKELNGLSPWGRMKRQLQEVDELIYTLIAERKAEPDHNLQDILSLMMAARDENGEPMSDEELRDELMTLLVAGHETTASALTWAFYWIDYLPEVREKLLQEFHILGQNPSRNIEVSEVTKLPYLNAVCQETLRIYPIVMTGFLRVLNSPMEIMGYQLPADTAIIPSVYMAHHRTDTYPEPEKFKPERFLERQFSPYEFLPFGGGNRRCIGMAFAQYEMKIAIFTILSKFQVSRPSRKPIYPVRRGLTIAAPARMKMVVTPAHKHEYALSTRNE